jgi:hypothetical protein
MARTSIAPIPTAVTIPVRIVTPRAINVVLTTPFWKSCANDGIPISEAPRLVKRRSTDRSQPALVLRVCRGEDDVVFEAGRDEDGLDLVAGGEFGLGLVLVRGERGSGVNVSLLQPQVADAAGVAGEAQVCCQPW